MLPIRASPRHFTTEPIRYTIATPEPVIHCRKDGRKASTLTDTQIAILFQDFEW
jgi:hypothetical protein